jgi:hypothetical protein
MDAPTLPNLHDATLVDVRVDWQKGTASLEFATVWNGTVTLRAIGLRELRIAREEPWGPSVSVNASEFVPSAVPDGLDLRIEMQSGDDIRLRASSIEVV